MKSKYLLIALVILILPLSLIAALYVPKGLLANRHEKRMELKGNDTDQVSIADIKTKIFYLEDKQPISSTVYYWKLRCGNQVINFEHVPDTLFWKWNVGESVPPVVILRLLKIDEQIHETYNLHKSRQN